MIAVIADDFTGAAEIGGIGLQYGLNVLIVTEITGPVNTDLLVVVADTRSMSIEKATSRIEGLTKKLLDLTPQFIYKKIDSVLRGNVYEELLMQQQIAQKKRIVIVPANPHFNRVIKNGLYYVDNVPLAKTSFANDPEFPLTSSDVREIIGDNPSQIKCLNYDAEIPERGFIVANVSSDEDIAHWVAQMDEQTVYGGGAGFFDAILKDRFQHRGVCEDVELSDAHKTLFVFGSTFPKTTDFMKKLQSAGMMFINLSEEYFQDLCSEPDNVDELADDIACWLKEGRKVVVTTIFTDNFVETMHPETVRREIGLLVEKVFQIIPVEELYIEGGATAAQIIKNLKVSQLKPVKELSYGIIQMQVDGYPNLSLITKPGSYKWPNSIIPDTN